MFGNILLIVPFWFINKLLFICIVLLTITLDISGQILPIKLLGSFGDTIYMINKLIFLTAIIFLLTLMWLIFKVDSKKQDILSIIDSKHNKIYGKNRSKHIVNTLKKYNINSSVNLMYYGYSLNRYCINSFDCKVNRLKACLISIYPNSEVILQNNKIYTDITIEYNNCITLRDYLDILQRDTLVLLKSNNNVLCVSQDVNLFVHISLFNSILGIILLSINKNRVFIIDSKNPEIFKPFCKTSSLDKFINIFDNICNANNFKSRTTIKYVLFIFCHNQSLRKINYILQYSIYNGIFVILIGHKNIYQLSQYITVNRSIVVYKHSFFHESINLPKVDNKQLADLLLFLQYQNESVI